MRSRREMEDEREKATRKAKEKWGFGFSTA
jgi:hypothetical protein